MIAVFDPIYPSLEGVIFHHNVVRHQTNYLTPYPGIPVRDPLGYRNPRASSPSLGNMDRQGMIILGEIYLE